MVSFKLAPPYPFIIYFLWSLGLYLVRGFPIFCGVSKQFMFYKIGFPALRPTPSNPVGQVGCFLFFRLLAARLPGIYGRPHKQLRDCQLSAMLPRVFCSQAVWGFKNYHGST